MKSLKKLAPVFIILGASLWGVDGVVLRPSLVSLPVPLVVFVESAIVALLLSPIFTRKLAVLKILSRNDWLAFIGVAIFGGAIGTMAITRALFYVNFVNLSIVILIQKLQPIFAILLASLLLRERFPSNFFLWAGFAVLGAYLMTFGVSIPNLNTEEKTVMAALFALFAAISFALSTVLSKRALRNIDFELGTYLRFTITVSLTLILVFSMGNISEISRISIHQIGIFFLIAFTTGGPAIFLYYYGLKRISASVATICELSFPLTAVILEYSVRGNLLNFIQWVGVGILFFSMIKVTRIRPITN